LDRQVRSIDLLISVIHEMNSENPVTTTTTTTITSNIIDEHNDDDEDSREEQPVEEDEEEQEETPQPQTLAEKKQAKKMRRAARAAEQAVNLVGSTHSNPDIVSTIMSAQHAIFGGLKLEELGPEERQKSRTHANPLSKQFLEVSITET
jgi:hypothetical protein